mgnify:CR=1 FL=1
MVIAMACFILNDSCIKTIGTTLPLGEIITIRGVLSVLVIVVICVQQGILSSVPSLLSGNVMARSLLDVAGPFMFLTALLHMPIAHLPAILQSVPLARGEAISALTEQEPADSPAIVTLCGLPPNGAIFSHTQPSAAI